MVTEHEGGVEPETPCVVATTVRPDRAGGGLDGEALTVLRGRAEVAGPRRVIAPVRPTRTASHPLTSMADLRHA